ncbi:MAG: hypothetical protein OXM61_16770 [Candidatus Poribacteria bacterium]|nr:hypothetical protein [Candidatus Poribacteria bacterium]
MPKKDFVDERVAKKQERQATQKQRQLKRSKKDVQKLLNDHDPHKRFRKEETCEE